MKKELIIKKPIIDVYNGYASIQSIILNVEYGNKWCIQHYLNYITYCDKDYKNIFMDYVNLGEVCFSSTNSFQPQHLCTVPWKTFILPRKLINGNIISFIKKSIDEGYYIFLYLNFKYLLNEGKDYIHDIFIYGYDDEKEYIFMKGYNKGKYGTEIYRFEQVEKAYNNVDVCDHNDFFVNFDVESISLVKCDETFVYEFSVNHFIENLELYLNDKKYVLNYYPTVLKNRNYNNSIVSFGNEGIEILKKYVEKKYEKKEKIDFRQLYFLKNNKEGFRYKWFFFLQNDLLRCEKLLED